jgi:hypothetical protein
MANLSTTSPLGEAAKGFQDAIQNVGAIQQIQQQQKQGQLLDIQLQEHQQAQKLNALPWDYKANDIYRNGTPEEQRLYDDRAKLVPPTQLGKQYFLKMVNEDLELADKISKGSKRTLESKALLAMEALQKDPENPLLQQDFNNKRLQSMEAGKAIDFSFNTMLLDDIYKTNKAAIDKSPALKTAFDISKKTGDIKVVTSLLDEAMKKKEISLTPIQVGAMRKYMNTATGEIVPGIGGQWFNPKKEKEDKPEWSPKQAMNRISAIDSAISRMKTTGTIDTATAIQNPLLAGLVDTKDPQAIKQAITSLQAERDEILPYAPKGYQKKVSAVTAPAQITYGDLYKDINAAGSSSKAVTSLMNKYGYSKEEATQIIRQGIQGGHVK